jgi:DUF1680 family protein
MDTHKRCQAKSGCPRSPEHRKDLLGGVTVIRAKDPSGIIAIPFYAWSNRGDGEMCLWLPAK